ncbi:MAG TPA: GNAT family N-acetyltransferase [Candidatus Limnocylindria bacterium]|jgi:GNAT superfamily N-acetyltransferase|nr:GNAT family N-acetyltransferase [Candidatus Limnocylindria bacterium]
MDEPVSRSFDAPDNRGGRQRASVVHISRIAGDEWALLRELRLRSLADSPDAFGSRLEEAQAFSHADWQAAARASAAGERRAWFIAWHDPGDQRLPVGLVQARRRSPADALLFSMWVAPEARRSGVGRLLVDAVDAWGATWGAKRIVLWVLSANDGAHRFYERLGFRSRDDGPDAQSGAAYGALAMERPVRKVSD